MHTTIYWQEKELNRFYQRRFTKYIFKENGNEIGYLQIKGTLNLEIHGKFMDTEIEFQYINEEPKSEYIFSPYLGVSLFDCENKECVAQIKGSLDINTFKKVMFEHSFLISGDYEYICEVEKVKLSFFERQLVYNVKKKEDSKVLIRCVYDNNRNGRIECREVTNPILFLASFYVLHLFIENYESN